MDNVDHPAHYQCGGIETIDVIRAKLGEGFGYYCEGNAIKYLTRWRSKGGVEDLRKAQVYLGWLVDFEMSMPPGVTYAGPFTAEEIALLDGYPATGANNATHVTEAPEAPPLPPLAEALIERAEAADDTHVGDLKAGEAVNG